MDTTTQAGSQFSLSSNLVLRPGCGYGLRQGHVVVEIRCQPGHLTGFNKFSAFFQEMLDEPLMVLPSPAGLPELVKWLAATLGTVLRNFKIASVRDVRVLSLVGDSHSIQTCQVALPTATAKSTVIGMKWLLTMVSVPPNDQGKAEAAFSDLQKQLKPFESASANQWRTIQAAYDMGYTVTPFMGPTVCIGSGVYRRFFSSFVTDRTPLLSMQVAQNKLQTAKLLRAHGLPGSRNKLVRSLDEALAAAKEMGYPLVIKPNDKDRGEGVSADLIQESDFVAAYEEASKCSQQVLVEKYQVGFTHRFTVVHDKVLRVAKHVAFGVVGDGVSSVEQLVAANALRIEEKKRVRRNLTANLALDGEALGLLKQYGLSKAAIPEAGQYVKLRRKDNVSAGGTRNTLDVAEQVHPDNIALALNAVRLIGLDFAGVDLITPDVGRSWREVPVTICEINGNPQLVARDDPQMYQRVLAHVMPEPVRVKANLVVFHTQPGTAQLQQLIQKFSPQHSFAGVSSEAGLWVNGQLCAGPFGSGYAAALALIVNSQIKQITCVMTIDELLKYGLPLGLIDHLFLPWQSIDQVPTPLKKNYQELMRMVLPHAEKTLYAKGT